MFIDEKKVDYLEKELIKIFGKDIHPNKMMIVTKEGVIIMKKFKNTPGLEKKQILKKVLDNFFKKHSEDDELMAHHIVFENYIDDIIDGFATISKILKKNCSWCSKFVNEPNL